MALALTGSRGGDMMSDRVKMTCPSCSYSCVPQWMNDEATCLKCFTVLRRRAVGAGAGAGAATHEPARRQVGEACTNKLSPSSALESEGGQCAKGPKGVHLYRFGKCSHCAKPEPVGQQALASKPTPSRATGASGTKPPPSPKEAAPPQTRAAAREEAAPAPTAEASSGEEAKSLGARNDRTKVECPHCGYKCVPQWLNDRAHCLKCQAVLKVQDSVHGSGGAAVAVGGSTRRASGEVSTYKAAPGDQMLHTSGGCSKSPDGQHLWRFGRCDHCAMAEGKTLQGAGACSNPGGVGGGCSAGGKCMYRFAKCTKCGKKEF
mmetsp:Transcript_23339/g.53962  ORF Transcript_23339/g.53962 Transcript_23339/m.53962 type:complete len:319 (-) Transcript_23339:429-1385(-)